MTDDYLATGIGQHRRDEAKRRDAVRNLADLSGAMRARVLGIELELGDRAIGYLNSAPGLVRSSGGLLLGLFLHEWFQCSHFGRAKQSLARGCSLQHAIDLTCVSIIF